MISKHPSLITSENDYTMNSTRSYTRSSRGDAFLRVLAGTRARHAFRELCSIWPQALLILALSLTLVAPLWAARAGKNEPANGPAGKSIETGCPEGTVCLAIPYFRSARAPSKSEKRVRVIASALPDLLQVALVRYPGIRLVSTGDLWRALRTEHEDPEQWWPENLARPEVLRSAGANYVLHGQLYERMGVYQFTGGIRSIDGEWRSSFLRSEPCPTRQLFAGVSTFADMIVNSLAEAGILDYHRRRFLVGPFRDVSESPDSRSAFYARDLPRALQEKAKTIDVVTVEHLESTIDLSSNASLRLTEDRENVDAAVNGEVELRQADDSVFVRAQIYIPELQTWESIPVQIDAGTSYIEQKYALIERFEQFTKLALSENGAWHTEFLGLPDHAPTLIDKAEALIVGDDLDAALFLLARALDLEPGSARALVKLGDVFYRQGEEDAAIVYARDALQQQPDLSEAYRLLGMAYRALGRYEEARKAFLHWSDLEPDSPEPHLALANILVSQPGNELKAIQELRQAIRLDPDNSEAVKRLTRVYMTKARRYLEDKNYGQAHEFYDRALRNLSDPDPYLYFQRALSYARAVTFDQISHDDGYQPAIDDYWKALELAKKRQQDPWFSRSVPITYLNIQELYILDGKYSQAVRTGQEILNLDSDQVDKEPWHQLIARFQTVAASLFARDPDEKIRRELLTQLGNKQRIPYRGWSFDLVEKYIEARKSEDPNKWIEEIEDLMNMVKAKP